MPPIPDLATIAEVIRHAAECEAERDARRPAEHPMYRGDDLELFLQPRPRWRVLVAYLRRLPEETVAGLYALYRLGDYPSPTAGEAAGRYRYSFELAMEPMHREHGATDLAAKGPLAAGLRHGLKHLGLELEPAPAHEPVDDMPNNPERITR